MCVNYTKCILINIPNLVIIDVISDVLDLIKDENFEFGPNKTASLLFNSDFMDITVTKIVQQIIKSINNNIYDYLDQCCNVYSNPKEFIAGIAIGLTENAVKREVETTHECAVKCTNVGTKGLIYGPKNYDYKTYPIDDYHTLRVSGNNAATAANENIYKTDMRSVLEKILTLLFQQNNYNLFEAIIKIVQQTLQQIHTHLELIKLSSTQKVNAYFSTTQSNRSRFFYTKETSDKKNIPGINKLISYSIVNEIIFTCLELFLYNFAQYIDNLEEPNESIAILTIMFKTLYITLTVFIQINQDNIYTIKEHINANISNEQMEGYIKKIKIFNHIYGVIGDNKRYGEGLITILSGFKTYIDCVIEKIIKPNLAVISTELIKMLVYQTISINGKQKNIFDVSQADIISAGFSVWLQNCKRYSIIPGIHEIFLDIMGHTYNKISSISRLIKLSLIG